MKTIKVKAPAKINLTLEVLGKREDGFHNIQSIMQTVSLYDILTITVENILSTENIIELSGNSTVIPYDKSNLVYKAAEKFLNEANINGKKISIYIEKHIPVAAGLAGGSSDAAGTLFGLNNIFDNLLTVEKIDEIAARLGSDVNFCLHGGTQIATSRGEKLERIPTPDLNIVIIKPKNLFISAKEAYDKYSNLLNKPVIQKSELMIDAIKENNPQKVASLLDNHLEKAILSDYPEIEQVKKSLIEAGCLNTIMSGSGPSVFGIYTNAIDLSKLREIYDEIFRTTTIKYGVIL